MLGRSSWDAGLPVVGLLFAILGLFVVGYALLERDTRDDGRVYLTSPGQPPLARYLAPTPVR